MMHHDVMSKCAAYEGLLPTIEKVVIYMSADNRIITK